MLQDVAVDQLTGTEDDSVREATTVQSTVEEVSSKTIGPSPQSVDNIDTVTSPVSDDRSQDTGLHDSNVVSSNRVCDPTVTAGVIGDHRLDETVTDSEKPDSADTDRAVEVETVPESPLMEVCDSTGLVVEDSHQPEPTSVAESHAGSNAPLADADIPPHRQLPDASDTTGDMRGLFTKQQDSVDAEVETVVVHGERGVDEGDLGSSSGTAAQSAKVDGVVSVDTEVETVVVHGERGVEEGDLGGSRSTAAQSAEVDGVGSAGDTVDIDVDESAVPHRESPTTSESVAGKTGTLVDGLPECRRSGRAGTPTEVCREPAVEHTAHIEGEVSSDAVDSGHVMGVDDKVCRESELADDVVGGEPDTRLSSSGPEATSQSEQTDANTVPPSSEVTATDVILSTGDGVPKEPDDVRSIVVDESVSEIKDSDAGQEASVAETGIGDESATGDWLDKVVDVSQVSFVSRDDIGDEVSAEALEMDEVAAVDDSSAPAVETAPETVGEVDTDSITAVETGHEVAAVDISSAPAVETAAETVGEVDADSVTAVETGHEVAAIDVSSAPAVETAPEMVGGVDAGGVTAVETAHEVDAETNASGKTSGREGLQENAFGAVKKADLPADSGTASVDVGETTDSQQVKSDVDDSREKTRLYAKNVVKPDTSAARPIPSITVSVEKDGTAPQQDRRAAGDQPSESQPVVMRKKSQQTVSTDDKENDDAAAAKLRKVTQPLF